MTPAAGIPRALQAGSVPARPPQGETRAGLGRRSDRGRRPGSGSFPVTAEAWAWDALKRVFPELAAALVAELELGERVSRAMRREEFWVRAMRGAR